MAETHVCSDITLRELHIDGYKIEQCMTNNKRTGGVMAIIRQDVKYLLVSEQYVENFVWLLSIELPEPGLKYRCTVLYHPPQKQDAQFIEFFESYIDGVSSFEGINVIVGDFNYDLLKHSYYGEKLINNVYSSGFAQIVVSPTRVTDKSKTLIDYIITNDKHLQHKVHHTPKISDHSILSISWNNQQLHFLNNKVTVTRRSLKNYDRDRLQEHFFNSPWNNSFGNVNSLAHNFVNDIKFILNTMCPLVNITYEQKYENKRWITEDIRKKWERGISCMLGQLEEEVMMSGGSTKRYEIILLSKLKLKKISFIKKSLMTIKIINKKCGKI